MCDSTQNQRWDEYKATGVSHLLRIPSFGVQNISTGGNAAIVNATSSDWGPSWKMIVEFGEEVKLHTIYPGGQSGNPGSYFYDNMVKPWSEGSLRSFAFSPDLTLDADTDCHIFLTPKKSAE